MNPSTERSVNHRPEPLGLGVEYLQLLGIPSALFAITTTGLWVIQRLLQQLPIPTLQVVIWLVASLGAMLLLLSWSGRRWFTVAMASAVLLLLALPIATETKLDTFTVLLSILLMAVQMAILLFAWPKSDPPVVANGALPAGSPPHQSTLPLIEDPSVNQSAAVGVAPTHGRRIAWLIVLGGIFIYMVVVPSVGQLIDTWREPSRMGKVLTDMTMAEQIRLHSVSGVVMLTFLAMGASIGSFLNVVIFRVPRRRPLLWPPSSCASCHTRIAGKDNIPIFAWILLGGRCRTCHQPLSIRYPIIEAVVAAYFVLFYYVELLSGGGNLPIRPQNSYRGIVWILLYTKWDLVSLYLFHMFALTTLLAWAMINWDRFAVPLRSSLIALLIIISLVAIFPHLNPVPLVLGGPPANRFDSLVNSLAGCLAGAGLGFLMRYQFPLPRATPSSSPVQLSVIPEVAPALGESPSVVDDFRVDTAVGEPAEGPQVDRYGCQSAQPATWPSTAASLALLGAACGLSLVLAVAAISWIALCAIRCLNRIDARWLKFPATLGIWGVAVLYLCLWVQLEAWLPNWWPKSTSSLATLAAFGGVVLIGVMAGAFLTGYRQIVPANAD